LNVLNVTTTVTLNHVYSAGVDITRAKSAVATPLISCNS